MSDTKNCVTVTVPEFPSIEDCETRLAVAYTALKLAEGYDWGCGHPHLDRYQAEVRDATSSLEDARHIASRR